MRIAVTGSSGFIGTALVPRLRAAGHEVVRFVRGSASAPDERPWDPSTRTLDPQHLSDVDAVIHLAGAGVADERWSDDRKAVVLDSRVDGTTAVAQAVAASGQTTVLLSP
jgi:NAD dependent epimerase/dehydratase family enzyme